MSSYKKVNRNITPYAGAGGPGGAIGFFEDTPVDNFRVNPNNEIGNEFDEFQNAVIQLGLAKPSEYYTMRGTAMKAILNKNNQTIYDLVYELLTDGNVNQQPVFTAIKDSANELIVPHYPRSLASNHAMSVCQAFNDQFEKIFNILVPPIGDKMANRKMETLGNAEGIGH
jgi:hypothetical protein